MISTISEVKSMLKNMLAVLPWSVTLMSQYLKKAEIKKIAAEGKINQLQIHSIGPKGLLVLKIIIIIMKSRRLTNIKRTVLKLSGFTCRCMSWPINLLALP